MDRNDKILSGVIIALVLVIVFLFTVPVKDGQTVLTVENGSVGSTIGEDGGAGGGIGDLDNEATDGEDGADENEPSGEPCIYPESFDYPSRSWWFEGHRCPTAVDDFFDRSEETDCYEVASTGDPYEYRHDITDWYGEYMEDLNWELVDRESGYINREDCWVWAALYYCEYDDTGLIAMFTFCPATVSRTGTGNWGQTMGDWSYISGKAEELEEIKDEMTE